MKDKKQRPASATEKPADEAAVAPHADWVKSGIDGVVREKDVGVDSI